MNRISAKKLLDTAEAQEYTSVYSKGTEVFRNSTGLNRLMTEEVAADMKVKNINPGWKCGTGVL